MLLFGHTGIACTVVRALDPRPRLRWIALASILPDLVDKPIAMLLPGFANGWTRLAAHSLTGLAVFALLAGLRLRARALPLVLAYATHLALDRLWEDPMIYFWPVLGFFPPPHPIPYWDRFWSKGGSVYTMAGEVIGLACWVRLLWIWLGRQWRRWRGVTTMTT